MKMSLRSRLRWILSAALLVALPKCGLCLMAWLALAMGARTQLCGETVGMTPVEVVAVGAVALVGFGLIATWLCPVRSRGLS